ncbi:hypothetical protein R6Q59_012126 [Mikania micrantha]
MVFCECGKEAIILTSWTNRNPSRRFYGCPNQAQNVDSLDGLIKISVKGVWTSFRDC